MDRIADQTQDVFSARELSVLPTSDSVLAVVRPSLVELGWQIESGRRHDQKVLLNGFQVDGWHPEGWILEVERGRAMESNAVHRNIVRAITVDDLKGLIIAVPNIYVHKNAKAQPAKAAAKLAQKLVGRLPFELVIFGY